MEWKWIDGVLFLFSLLHFVFTPYHFLFRVTNHSKLSRKAWEVIFIKCTFKKAYPNCEGDIFLSTPLSRYILFPYTVFLTTLSRLKMLLGVYSSIFEADFVPRIKQIIETV